ncbi:MAG: metallophosphoesterase, partial [bacterium]
MPPNRLKRLNLELVFILCRITEVFTAFAQAFGQTPPNFKVAFFGDQGVGENARAVLNLVKAEGTQAVLHLGDFDYNDDPAAWDAQIDDVLGANFPYFACIGNHDESAWRGADGYQKY